MPKHETKLPVSVAITIDTEFSIGGAFLPGTRRDPLSDESVWCMQGNESHGLGYLLRVFSNYGVKGTFFVETLNTYFHGMAKMGGVVERIALDGHEMHPHTHPVWMQVFEKPRWRERLESITPNDDISVRSRETILRILEHSRRCFRTWSVGEIKAIRTGNLRASRGLYHTLRGEGINVASNIGMGVHGSDYDSALCIDAGMRVIDGVKEYPVTSYRLKGPFNSSVVRCLTLVGSTMREIQAVLDDAYERQYGPVIILTHPFEFSTVKDERFKKVRGNKRIKRRMEKFLDYVVTNKSRFSIDTLMQIDQQHDLYQEANGPALPMSMTFLRVVENRLGGWF